MGEKSAQEFDISELSWEPSLPDHDELERRDDIQPLFVCTARRNQILRQLHGVGDITPLAGQDRDSFLETSEAHSASALQALSSS